MENPPKITLVIPTLNEIEGLKITIPRIDQSLFEEILVIDASSTDGTVEYIQISYTKEFGLNRRND